MIGIAGVFPLGVRHHLPHQRVQRLRGVVVAPVRHTGERRGIDGQRPNDGAWIIG